MMESVSTRSASPSKLSRIPVPQHRQRDCTNVVGGNVNAVVQQCANLGAQNQRLSPAGTGAIADILFREVVRRRLVGMRRQNEPNRVLLHRPRDRDRQHGVAHVENLLAGEHLLRLGFGQDGRPIEDRVHARDRWVVDAQLHEEAIQLGFGKGIGPFHLQGVLRRQNEKRQFQVVRFLADGDRLFLHCFQKSGLSLRCGPVDLVSQNHVAEDGTGLEFQVALAVIDFLDDVRPRDVGRHQIRCELNSRELQVQCAAQGLNELGLAQAWNAFQQDVPAREQSHQDAVNDGFGPDDHLGHFVLDDVELLSERFDLPVDLSRGHLVS